MNDCEQQIIASLKHAATESPTPERTIMFEELASLLASLQLEAEQEAGAIEHCGQRA